MRAAILSVDEAAEYFLAAEGCHILELSNSDADPTVSIARARVATGTATRWHRLHGVVERYVILAGRGRVETAETVPQDVAQGDVVLIPAGCPQRITNTGSIELVFLAICTPRFTPDVYTVLDDADPGH